jgi:hypothetical protein
MTSGAAQACDIALNFSAWRGFTGDPRMNIKRNSRTVVYFPHFARRPPSRCNGRDGEVMSRPPRKMLPRLSSRRGGGWPGRTLTTVEIMLYMI